VGEDAGCFGQLLADNVRVHPERDRRVGTAEPGCGGGKQAKVGLPNICTLKILRAQVA
jgi:hypothetical protein